MDDRQGAEAKWTVLAVDRRAEAPGTRVDGSEVSLERLPSDTTRRARRAVRAVLVEDKSIAAPALSRVVSVRTDRGSQ